MTAALVSVYYPATTIKDHIKAIASQVDAVYICDNSPNPNHWMFAEIDERDNIRYAHFCDNLGLSAAFNQILTDPFIPWEENDYIFFFDQDSLIKPQHVARMLGVYEDLQKRGFEIGCLGPVYFNTSSGIVEIPKIKDPLTDNTYAVSSIITSSMLCTYGDLRSIGFWNARVFLDMADWDLCWRMKAAGKLCCLTEAVTLHHALGSGQKKIGPLTLRIGKPFREYYQIRECLYLLFRSYTPLKYRIRFVAMLFIRSPLHLLFLDQRKQRLGYMAKGFIDFFRGKHGSIDPDISK